MNKASSRSHAVFQIRVTRRQRATTGEDRVQKMKTTYGTLSVVDLAGSERVKQVVLKGKSSKKQSTSTVVFLHLEMW